MIIYKEIAALNDLMWYEEIDILKINRVSLLSIVGSIELTLRHPNLSPTLRETIRFLGKHLALRLLTEGLMLPDDVLASWRQTFQI